VYKACISPGMQVIRADGVTCSLQGGTWTAILDVSGEAYQAFFDSQGAAMEALNAAGVLPRSN
jgi:hypothetical protein